MDERSNANRRQRKRRPKWQQYIPTVIVSVLALIALASVITAVIAGIRHYSNQNDDPNHVIQNNPTSSSTT
jgi:negative regulator of sigma E activity